MRWWKHKRRPLPSAVVPWGGLEWVLAGRLFRPLETDRGLWVCTTDRPEPDPYFITIDACATYGRLVW